jgi:AraC-like DNA-binding protein
MARYYTIPPPPQLAAFVRSFWVFEMDVPQAEPYIYRSMADGCAELVFHYKGPFTEVDGNGFNATSLVHAQSQKHHRFITHGGFGIFGAYMYPYALQYLFTAPASAFSNELVSMDTLLGHEGRLLEERIMLAKTNIERAKLLGAFIEKRIKQYSPRLYGMHHAVAHVVHSKGVDSVKQLSERYCLSARQFERKFKQLSGFTPKMYSRIIRFQAATQFYGKDLRALSDIAYDCGYYDQSHFIHDFKEFSGYHPSSYFTGRPEGIDYRDGG